MNVTKDSCVEFILNCEFGKAEGELRDRISSEIKEKKPGHCSMSLAVVTVIRALLSQSETDFNLAMIQLKDTQLVSRKMFHALTLQLCPNEDQSVLIGLKVKDDPRFLESDLMDPIGKLYYHRAVSELIVSECTLLQTFLNCLQTGKCANVFHALLSEAELIKLRAAWLALYHAHDRFNQLPAGHKLSEDEEYRNGLHLSWGICNLMALLLPKQLGIILGTFGFQLASISEALETIEVATCGAGLHSLLAKMVIMTYHLDIAKDPDASINVLRMLEADDSATPLVQYFKAKILHLQGKTCEALDVFAKIRINPAAVLQLPIHWQIVQCFAEDQKWPEAIQYTRLLRHSNAVFPSKIFSLYMEAAFLHASTGRELGSPSIEVQALLSKILEEAKAVHTPPRPFLDRLAVMRARNTMYRREHFYLPHFEILLLWDRFDRVGHREFIRRDVRKTLESSGQLTLEQQALGWLVLALLSESPTSGSKLILNHILPRERSLQLEPFTVLRAKCELALNFLKEEHQESCLDLVCGIEMKCFDKNGFPGLSTILQLASKIKIQLEKQQQRQLEKQQQK
jgi:hypothetical protein